MDFEQDGLIAVFFVFVLWNDVSGCLLMAYRQPEKGWGFVVGFGCNFNHTLHASGALRTCIHYSHRHLLCPKNAATALKMLARCPTLLCFLPCIRAFMS